MMQKVCIKFIIWHLQDWEKVRWSKGTKLLFLRALTAQQVNKEELKSFNSHYYKMTPSLHPFIENTYIHDSYKQPTSNKQSFQDIHIHKHK